jgi:hypothetical protein
MLIRLYVLLCLIILTGCTYKHVYTIKARPSYKQREKKLETNLDEVTKKIIKIVGKQRVAFPGIFRGKSRSEPGVSKYITPYILGKLANSNIVVVERRDLKKLFIERMATKTSLNEEDMTSMTKLAKADILIIAKLEDLTPNTYKIVMKFVNITNSKILATLSMSIDRRNLPVKYGGT